MKHMTNKKINSEKGVTILLALVGFMAAAMVSIVIVTAALSASRSVMNDRENTQAHLTLESAAKIVRNQMDNAYGSVDTQTIVTKTSSGSSGAYTYGSSGTFGSEMLTAVQYIDTYKNNYESAENALTISVADPDSNVKNVLVSFVMSYSASTDDGNPYHLIFTFRLQDSEEEVYLNMNGVDDTDNHKIYWKTISINEIGGSSGN